MSNPTREIRLINKLLEHYTIKELAEELERSFSWVWSWKVGKFKPDLQDWKKLRYLDRQLKVDAA